MVFKHLLLVVLAASLLRLLVWTAYEIFEWRSGNIVLHEEIDEFALLIAIDLLVIPLLVYLLMRITRSVTRPLTEIAKSSEAITRGQLDARIETTDLPAGELTQVADALNNAFDHYAETNSRIARFTGDASHQLRTPLSAIQTTAELALAGGRVGSVCQNALASILEESRRLNKLCETLLSMSRLDQHQARASMEPVEMEALVTKVVDTFGQLAESKGLRLHAETEPMRVQGDESLLFELLANLVDNAIKACTAGDEILLRFGPKKQGPCVMWVEDSGPGIPASEQQRIFDRFHRAQDAGYGGTGLGLALCVEICRVHQGRIEIQPGRLPGASFRMTFPARAPSADA